MDRWSLIYWIRRLHDWLHEDYASRKLDEWANSEDVVYDEVGEVWYRTG